MISYFLGKLTFLQGPYIHSNKLYHPEKNSIPTSLNCCSLLLAIKIKKGVSKYIQNSITRCNILRSRVDRSEISLHLLSKLS